MLDTASVQFDAGHGSIRLLRVSFLLLRGCHPSCLDDLSLAVLPPLPSDGRLLWRLLEADGRFADYLDEISLWTQPRMTWACIPRDRRGRHAVWPKLRESLTGL